MEQEDVRVTLEVKPVRALMMSPLAGAWKRETDRWTWEGANGDVSKSQLMDVRLEWQWKLSKLSSSSELLRWVRTGSGGRKASGAHGHACKRHCGCVFDGERSGV